MDKRHIIDVTDFGARPGSGLDAGSAVARAAREVSSREGATLRFPKGRYDFLGGGSERRDWPMSNTDDVPLRTIGILLEGGRDLSILGEDATLVFHVPMTAIGALKVEGLKVGGFTVDFEPPFNADAEVLESGPGRILLRVDPARHPFEVRRGRLIFTGHGWRNPWKGGAIEFERGTRLIPQGSGDRSLGQLRALHRAIRRGRDLVELLGLFGNPPREGNYLVLRHGERDHAGLFFDRCSGVRVEDLAIHNTSGLGILVQHCDGASMNRVRCAPAPGRYLAGHDDGMHFSNCRGLVEVQDCVFAGLMDDPVNVHGTSARILAFADGRIRARFTHPQSVAMEFARPGDRVSFIRAASMESLGTATTATFNSVGRREFELALDGRIPPGLRAGDALENLSATPDVQIRRCDFLPCRARGILVSTPGRVRIEDNHFESSGSAILIPGDANNWYESGAVRDVIVSGNRFGPHCLSNRYQFCEAVVSVCPEIPRPRAGLPFHRNIRIEGNRFELSGQPAVYAFSTEGLVVAGNRMARVRTQKDWHPRAGIIALKACRGATVEGNEVAPDIADRRVTLEAMERDQLFLGEGQGLEAP